MIKDKHMVSTFMAEDLLEVTGVNDRLALSKVTKIMQRRINEKLMLFSGVTLTDPDSVYIGDDVNISNDVIIQPNTFIFGKSSIGSGSIIGPLVQLYDCHIGANTSINSAVLIEAEIGANNNIGPFSYIRPGTVTGDKVKIGGFCEVKKSRVGKNSKIPHLTYIGDTEIGNNVNIGASSVTCNYDGYRKNKTVIGNNVFIGSDTMLVPPVEIGNGAIVAAGSVITENVPDNSLAIARNTQVNVEGGAAKYRAKKEMEKNEGADK
jgi:bifunctional UDP-N-acetylglucosamine pyrophosphorylase/glucosamine-1-phosphate N-acetyltransferase